VSDAGIFRFLKVKDQWKTIRILLVHSGGISLDRIQHLLKKNSSDNLHVHQVSTAERALDHLHKNTTDLVITDFHIDGTFNLPFVRSLSFVSPHVKILVVSTHDEVRFVNEILLGGVQGYLLTSQLDKELSTAIGDVIAGKRFVSAEVNNLLVHLMDTSNEAQR
jgi:DNA-binding NarL/FixJ family response regulator